MNFSFFLVIFTEVIFYFVKKYFVRPSRMSIMFILFFIVAIETVKGNAKMFEESASLKY